MSYSQNTIPEYFGDWDKVISLNELNSVTLKLKALYKTTPITPKIYSVFKAFNICEYRDLKVVILGQDPYPQQNVATGLLFANVNTEESKLSPSLKIVKESLLNPVNTHKNIIFDDDMEIWAKEGMLLINTALTVVVGRPGSHSMLWRPFMISLLKNLAKRDTGIVYVLLGEQAKSFKMYINAKDNYILEEKHPAYFARQGTRMPSIIYEELDKIIYNNHGIHLIYP